MFFINIFNKLYATDTENIISRSFPSSKILKYSVWCPAWRSSFEISNSFTSHNFCALKSMTGSCLTPPFHSLFPFTLYKGCFCTSCVSLSLSPSERPSACLLPPSTEEKIPEAAWGQRGGPATRGSGTRLWAGLGKVRGQQELLLVLTDKSGHKEIRRKWPGVVRGRAQREGGGLLSKNRIFGRMEDKKNWILG